MSQHPGDVGGDQLQQVGAVGGGRGSGGLRSAVGLGQVPQQPARPRVGVGAGELCPVGLGDDREGLVVVEYVLKRVECPARVQFAEAEQGALAPHGIQGRHAAFGPDAPRDGGRGAAPGAVLCGQGVEEGVAGGVGRAVAVAPHARGGGEQDEGVEVRQEFRQVRRPGDLGPDDLGELRRCRVGQPGRPDHAGGVEDRADVADALDEVPQRVPVRHVARRHGHPCPGFLQFVAQAGRAGCVGAAAGGQHDVLRALPREAAGHMSAERAGAAGDQHRAPRPPGTRGRAR
ncbi:hypothetical protein ACE1SV_06940 [Streptomyces sp. E-15]